MKINIQNIMRGINGADIKVRYGIFFGILLAVFALDYFLIMAPQIRSLKGLGEAAKTTSADVQRVNNDLQRIRQIKDGLNSSRAELEAMSVKVRSLQEVPVILEEISRTANQFNVKIDQVKPLSESQETLISTPEEKYYALPIVIQARSGYHMFGHFLNTLESGRLFLTLTNWRMEAGGQADKEILVQATLKVILTQKP
ncbi:MAG TPA: type 4a pilus biogenesis protein PilO [Candidatus Omnitrophota bacterium]|nr:type 4a pilus biogenesis protein PilO [Candidatus Omnitrophota bacterium]